MHVERESILLIAALVGSLLSIGPQKTRVMAIIAAVVAGVALTLSLGVLHISLPYVNLVVFGALTVLGVLLFLRVEKKIYVAAATVVTAVGALGLLETLAIAH